MKRQVHIPTAQHGSGDTGPSSHDDRPQSHLSTAMAGPRPGAAMTVSTGPPPCTPRGGVNTDWAGNSCAVLRTTPCPVRGGINTNWAGNKCAAIQIGTSLQAMAQQGLSQSSSPLPVMQVSLQSAPELVAPAVQQEYSFVVADLGWGAAAMMATALALVVARFVASRVMAALRKRIERNVERWQAEHRAQHIPEIPAAQLAEVERLRALWREMDARRKSRLQAARARSVEELLGRSGSDEDTEYAVLLQFHPPARPREPDGSAPREARGSAGAELVDG